MHRPRSREGVAHIRIATLEPAGEPAHPLSKIAKQYYGNAMKYNQIFEANRPMLEDPNKIYPGQMLRIPKLDG